MSDYIDRQAALNAINIEREYMTRRQEWGAEHILTHYGYRIIADMPSAEVEPVRHGKWIPVAERLPDLWDERYLVSLAWGGVGVMEYKSTGFHNYGSFSPVPIEIVTAWMPLPEPYKEDEQG